MGKRNSLLPRNGDNYHVHTHIHIHIHLGLLTRHFQNIKGEIDRQKDRNRLQFGEQSLYVYL